MCNKANASIAFLRRNLQISQQHIKANAYTTLVRPQVEYAAVVWDPYTQENQHKIEMVQRRAARYVCNNYTRDASLTTMLHQLGWRSLLQRRAYIRLVFLYKCINCLVAVDLSRDLIRPTRPSRHRNSRSYNVPFNKRDYIQQSFLRHTLTQWNQLPESMVKSPSLDTFKERVPSYTPIRQHRHIIIF